MALESFAGFLGGLPPVTTLPTTIPGPGFPGAGMPGGFAFDPRSVHPAVGGLVCDFLTGPAKELCLLGVDVFMGDPTGGAGAGLGDVSVEDTMFGPGVDPTPRTTTPAEASLNGGIGTRLAAPSAENVRVHKCPKFGNGKHGIVYMHVITGELGCLPRGTSSSTALALGWVRKNKPAPKPFLSRTDEKALRAQASKSLKSKAKDLAKWTGQKCVTR